MEVELNKNIVIINSDNREAYRLFYKFVKSSNIAYCINNLEGQFIGVNESFEKLTGFSFKQLSTLKFDSFVENLDYHNLIQLLKDRGAIYNYKANFNWGVNNVIPVKISAFLIQVKEEYYFIFNINPNYDIIQNRLDIKQFDNFDIDNSMHRELKIKQNTLYITEFMFNKLKRDHQQVVLAMQNREDNLAHLFQSLKSILVVVNRNLIVERINQVALSFLGISSEDANQKPFEDVFKSTLCNLSSKSGFGFTILDAIHETFRTGYSFEDIDVYNNQYCEDTKTKMLFSTILYSYNNNDYVLLTITDLSDQMQLEIELQEAQKVALQNEKLKSAFLANLSHEIRTPLNAIVGFTEILCNKENLLESDTQRYFEIIKQNSNNLIQVVEDLMDLSKIESEQYIVSNYYIILNHYLNDIYQLVQAKAKELNKDIKISLLNDEDVIIGRFDPFALRKILMHLIFNALKFTEKGEIKFGISGVINNKIELMVSDTGIGIPANCYEYIFSKFTQLACPDKIFGGNGLGLFIAQSLVKLMGSEITVSSEVGMGSVFKFTIDVSDNPEADITKTTSWI